MAFLADEYCSYCQGVLQNVKNRDLERVGSYLHNASLRDSSSNSLPEKTSQGISSGDALLRMLLFYSQRYKVSPLEGDTFIQLNHLEMFQGTNKNSFLL